MNSYEEILLIPSFEPNIKHPRMSIYNRSAQFAPFAALSGFEDEISEVSRTTTNKIELDDDQKDILNDKINNLKCNERVHIKYFIKDKYKMGGKYIERNIIFKRINTIRKTLVLDDKTEIIISNIIELNKIE